MTWLSKRLLVKDQRKLQRHDQQLCLIKQKRKKNSAELKENFSEFATSLEGLLAFTASGAVYQLMQPAANEQSSNKSESSISSMQRWLLLAEKLQLW